MASLGLPTIKFNGKIFDWYIISSRKNLRSRSENIKSLMFSRRAVLFFFLYRVNVYE